MRSRTALLGGLAVVLLVIGGAALAWVLFLQGDNVAPLALPSSVPAAEATAPAGGSPAATAGGESLAPASAPIDAADIPGIWSIASDSVVGYRVRERLASLSADSDAIGRTNAVTGTATIAGSGTAMTVSDANFSVDMTSLRSDRPMRDNRLRNDGIQTDQFPTSTFKLGQPITLPAGATTGAAVDVTLHGDLTLHGVTRTVDIPAKARLSGNLIEVAGSQSFPFSDYQINPPNIGGFVAVQDTGTLEFLINLVKS